MKAELSIEQFTYLGCYLWCTCGMVCLLVCVEDKFSLCVMLNFAPKYGLLGSSPQCNLPGPRASSISDKITVQGNMMHIASVVNELGKVV